MKNLMIIAAIGSAVICSSANAASTMHSQGKPAKTAQTQASTKQRLGTLSCTVSGGVGYLIGSNKSVECSFKRQSGRAERYVGSIGKLGIDVGVSGKSYLSWVVYTANASEAGKGDLAGTYRGASASAAVGLGLGANALIGGTSKNFGLQPLSAQAGTGLNVAAGISSLTLRYGK